MKTKNVTAFGYMVRFIEGSTLVLRKLSIFAGELGKLFKAISKAIPSITLVAMLILTSTGQISAMQTTKAVDVTKAAS